MSAANAHSVARGLFRMAVNAFTKPVLKVEQLTARNVAQAPYNDRASVAKLVAVSAASLYLGGLIAHTGASFLEDYEIFVPAEDDDDD